MNIFLMGGWMMWPLALVSVTVTAVMAERILLFSSCPFPPKDFTECLERAVEGDTARLLASWSARTPAGKPPSALKAKP